MNEVDNSPLCVLNYEASIEYFGIRDIGLFSKGYWDICCFYLFILFYYFFFVLFFFFFYFGIWDI